MDYQKLADKKTVENTIKELNKRGIESQFVDSSKQALITIIGLISQGAGVMTGGSTTLDQIGFTDYLSSFNHGWKNLKRKIMEQEDEEKRLELRKKNALAEYHLGSVQAVTQNGEILIASATGSQIPAYAYTGQNIIWVAGTQKIVTDIKAGFQRVKEYCYPLEDQRMKQNGYMGSAIGKVLIFEREINPQRNIILIFVNEKLGF